MLFHIVFDMLAVMIESAKSDSQIVGVIADLVDGGFLSFNMPMTQFSLWNTTLKKREIRN